MNNINVSVVPYSVAILDRSYIKKRLLALFGSVRSLLMMAAKGSACNEVSAFVQFREAVKSAWSLLLSVCGSFSISFSVLNFYFIYFVFSWVFSRGRHQDPVLLPFTENVAAVEGL